MSPAASTPGPVVSRRRAALENLAFGWASTAFTIVQGILLVPFYLRVISVEQYGGWLATGGILAWVELADPGISAILQQRVARASGARDAEALARLVPTGVALTGLLALVPLALLPLAGLVPGLLPTGAAAAPGLVAAFELALVSVAAGFVANGFTAVNVGMQRMRPTGFVHLLAMCGGVASTILLLHQGAGLLSIPGGTLTRWVIAALGNGWLVARWARRSRHPLRVRLEEARLLGQVATFTMVSRVGAVLLGRVDALVCAWLVSPAAAVVLSLTGRVIDVVRLVADRVGIATMPGLAHLAGERGDSSAATLAIQLARVTSLLVAVLAASITAWNGPLVSLWVGRDQYGGLLLTALLAAAAAFGAIGATLGQALFALGGVRQQAMTTLGEAGARLAGQLLLVPHLGLAGFPLAAMSAMLMVSGVLVPMAIARRGGLAVRQLWLVLGGGVARVLLLLAVGAGIALQPWVQATSDWPRLVILGGLTGLALCGLVVPLDQPTVRLVARALASRRRPGAAT